MLKSGWMLPVREDYQTYTPPAWVRKTVYQLLESLRAEHVAGLAAVVLTDSVRVGKGKTRRVSGRKHAMNECLGFYVPGRRSERPSILLVVDNMIGKRPSWLWWLPLMRETAVAGVLFHEVGHHLNATIGSLAGGEEASADAWKRRLARIYTRRKWRYLGPIRQPLLRLVIVGLRMLGQWVSPPSRRGRGRHGSSRTRARGESARERPIQTN